MSYEHLRYAFGAGLETALLADIRIAAENAEFGALERRWNIVGGDGLTVRLPLEAEMTLSMFMRRDSHTIGAAAFKAGNLTPEWPNHGL